MASSSPAANALIAKLDAFYDAFLTFQTNRSDENLQRLGAFFAPSCIAEPRSMRHWKHRAIGRDAAMQAYREMLGEQVLKERRVVSQVAVADADAAAAGPRVYCEMANRYDVQGLELDPMLETVVVRFSNALGGEIVEWKTYNCQSPVAALTQQATGKGLYANVRVLPASVKDYYSAVVLTDIF
ncbi:hypothetical protein BJX68DRAFT_273351 [Aspergillus pseudodeflectus]|uniref:SnoaL-like domain-containing protein n=1 Tax=Aspergillus pseudodeflectus TaxID=176178 RepID=A0ABR4J9R5_9EURO